ncbi:BTB/POZ domain-containing protein [Ditylenchus destructor]|nr:BTB/POZ domain-containing protein [Ditylenchus destructor]
MSGTNPATNTSNNWVRLNVGGKTFQTTKNTLSRYPDSFLARLVNGDLASEKDETGAYLVDGNPELFDTILTYLRRGILNLDRNEKTTKDLLAEADFYNIEPLVEEIRQALSAFSPSRIFGKSILTSAVGTDKATIRAAEGHELALTKPPSTDIDCRTTFLGYWKLDHNINFVAYLNARYHSQQAREKAENDMKHKTILRTGTGSYSWVSKEGIYDNVVLGKEFPCTSSFCIDQSKWIVFVYLPTNETIIETHKMNSKPIYDYRYNVEDDKLVKESLSTV